MTFDSRDATCGATGFRYSTQLPTEPGYYWMRIDEGGNFAYEYVVEISKLFGELRLSKFTSPRGGSVLLDRYEGAEFAGPIPEPEG